MPLDARLIEEHRKRVLPQNRDEALKRIAALDPKSIVPIIIAIIDDGINCMTNDPTPENTKNFLAYAKETLCDADEKNNLPLSKLKSALKDLNKDIIEGKLSKLVEKSAEITITSQNALVIWKEAERWLEGWYLHTADNKKLKRDKDGKPVKGKNGMYNSIDWEDTGFQTIVGLSKLQVAEYYGKAAALLRLKIEAYEQELKSAQEQQPTVQPQPETEGCPVAVSQADGITTFSLKMPLDGDAIERITAAIKAAALPHSQPSPVSTFSEPIAEENKVMEDADLQAVLTDFMSESEDIRISILGYAINRYTLTDNQKKVLNNLKVDINANLKNYTNGYYLFSRSHAGLVDEVTPKISRADDPVRLLNILLDMRTTLIGECSDDLLKKVNGLLLGAYTLLRKVPQQDMRLSSGHAARLTATSLNRVG